MAHSRRLFCHLIARIGVRENGVVLFTGRKDWRWCPSRELVGGRRGRNILCRRGRLTWDGTIQARWQRVEGIPVEGERLRGVNLPPFLLRAVQNFSDEYGEVFFGQGFQGKATYAETLDLFRGDQQRVWKATEDSVNLSHHPVCPPCSPADGCLMVHI